MRPLLLEEAKVPGMLLSDAERDQASALLRDQYSVGRLTLEEYSRRIDEVLAAHDTSELAVAFVGLSPPAWLAAPTPPARPWPSWVTAVTGLGAALAAAELMAVLAATAVGPRDQEHLPGALIIDATVMLIVALQSVAWIALIRRREWAPAFALIAGALLTLATFGVGLLVAVPVWWGLLRRTRDRNPG